MRQKTFGFCFLLFSNPLFSLCLIFEAVTLTEEVGMGVEVEVGFKCVVPENIHTSPTEGHRNSEGWWGVKVKFSKGEGGSQTFSFQRVLKCKFNQIK